MTALYIPPGMLSNATTKVAILTAIVDMSAPKLTELNAGTTVDISCYLTGDGWNPNVTENTITDERLCTEQIFEEPGDYTESLEATFIYDNVTAADDKARLALTPYTLKFAVVRIGKKAALAWAIGDLVDVYSFKGGQQRKNAGGRNTKFNMTQRMFLNQITQRDVALVA